MNSERAIVSARFLLDDSDKRGLDNMPGVAALRWLTIGRNANGDEFTVLNLNLSEIRLHASALLLDLAFFSSNARMLASRWTGVRSLNPIRTDVANPRTCAVE